MLLRRLLAIVLILLAGPVVNVAVAWGCAVTVSPAIIGPALWQGMPPEHQWSSRRYAVGFVRLSFYSSAPGTSPLPGSGMPGWARALSAGQPAGLATIRNGEQRAMILQANGWPCLSVGGAIVVDDSEGVLQGRTVEAIARTPLTVPQAPWDSRILPLRPLWPGFLANSLLYSGVLLLLAMSPFAQRRFIRYLRLQRGLCPSCAYPMGGSEVCSECGRALPGPASAAT